MKFVQTYPAVAASVPDARAELAGFAADAGAGPDELEAIRLVTSEALTNIVRHAYPDRTGQVHVSAQMADGELCIQIADNGCGLGAGGGNGGLGLGLVLMRTLADGFAIRALPCGGTELRIRFDLAASHFSATPERARRATAGQAAP
jgi:serine/threonine-protein kinase RsbW